MFGMTERIDQQPPEDYYQRLKDGYGSFNEETGEWDFTRDQVIENVEQEVVEALSAPVEPEAPAPPPEPLQPKPVVEPKSKPAKKTASKRKPAKTTVAKQSPKDKTSSPN